MKEYREKREALESRTIDFSVNLINKLGKHSQSKTLGSAVSQSIRSASSIGANYAEANNSSSSVDFRNKIFIAKKEAAETRYWLEVLARLLPNEDLSLLQQEAKELNLILQKIISTMKNNEK